MPAIVAGLYSLAALLGQTNILTVEEPARVTARRNATAQAKIKVVLQPEFHVNSNTPSEDYLIPLRLTWTPGPLEPADVLYPKPHMEKYEFSPNPLSVFTGNFELTAMFKVAANAPIGPGVMLGKLRYQACNKKACFPPKNVEVKLPFSIQ
jgi:cytochrome c biogenesis DsbD-like protein